MKKIVLLFSHTLTPSQREDISTTLNITEIYSLSTPLQAIWSQVPTDRDLVMSEYLKEIKDFVLSHLDNGDYLLIQGDFGATYTMVNFAKKYGFVPLYSVNRRISSEKIEDGIVKKYSEFRHQFFREYI